MLWVCLFLLNHNPHSFKLPIGGGVPDGPRPPSFNVSLAHRPGARTCLLVLGGGAWRVPGRSALSCRASRRVPSRASAQCAVVGPDPMATCAVARAPSFAAAFAVQIVVGEQPQVQPRQRPSAPEPRARQPPRLAGPRLDAAGRQSARRTAPAPRPLFPARLPRRARAGPRAARALGRGPRAPHPRPPPEHRRAVAAGGVLPAPLGQSAAGGVQVEHRGHAPYAAGGGCGGGGRGAAAWGRDAKYPPRPVSKRVAGLASRSGLEI